MNRERRRTKRVQIQKEVFAAFVLSDGPVIVGRVMDASLNGLSVQYLATEKLRKGQVSISIFAAGSPGLNRLQTNVMYDLEVPGTSWSAHQTRRCGICFTQYRSEFRAWFKGFLGSNREAGCSQAH